MTSKKKRRRLIVYTKQELRSKPTAETVPSQLALSSPIIIMIFGSHPQLFFCFLSQSSINLSCLRFLLRKMYGTIRFSPSLRFRTQQPTTPRDPSRDFSLLPRILSFSSSKKNLCLVTKSVFFPGKIEDFVEEEKIRVTKEGSIQEHEEDDAPVSIALTPINSESQFDRVVAEAQQLDESVIIVWMANWCRKCIYLKPKLEKLAADYHPRLQFYYVDVNTVPYNLVSRAGVTKMPTVQLWKDGKKQEEVIGGHKAYIVINEVREMIENVSNV